MALSPKQQIFCKNTSSGQTVAELTQNSNDAHTLSTSCSLPWPDSPNDKSRSSTRSSAPSCDHVGRAHEQQCESKMTVAMTIVTTRSEDAGCLHTHNPRCPKTPAVKQRRPAQHPTNTGAVSNEPLHSRTCSARHKYILQALATGVASRHSTCLDSCFSFAFRRRC